MQGRPCPCTACTNRQWFCHVSNARISRLHVQRFLLNTTPLQLYGQDLFPFTVDKQNVVLLTLSAVFNSLVANPVFSVNISNFAPDGHTTPEHSAAPPAGRR